MSELNPRTHAFVLLREWIKTGKLSEKKTHELTEIITDMANKEAAKIIERFEAQLAANAKMQNRTYYLLIWAIGFATVILSGVMIFTRNG